MNRYCLDTSAYSNFKRGHRAAVEIIDSARWIGMPAIVLGELRTGFLLGARARQNEEELVEFLKHPLVEELPVDSEVARAFAEIVVALRRAGTPLPPNDIWIAAVAACSGAPVLTYDAHFSEIARVTALVLPLP